MQQSTPSAEAAHRLGQDIFQVQATLQGQLRLLIAALSSLNEQFKTELEFQQQLIASLEGRLD